MVAVVPGLAPMTSGLWEVAARANPGSWNCGNDHVPPGCSAGLHEPSAWLEHESSARVKHATVTSMHRIGYIGAPVNVAAANTALKFLAAKYKFGVIIHIR
jgi:hypothetical protein